ncbi:hypothetical protein KKH27_14530 [bacterium]|nr:hypothetical protein [bacterium]MBU1983372.1 hypothetical protein [bacterium]
MNLAVYSLSPAIIRMTGHRSAAIFVVLSAEVLASMIIAEVEIMVGEWL